ncbi:hypothetical protein FO519_006440 [Halicephalobus sp. NKZ332]|nr:hypothetical protein FO519_006440 [Halicephalobus sp. NKZ332]
MVSSVSFILPERDVLKAILEYLETRGLHITQLSLERETGLINGEFSDDILFLRQLILDGQWDNVLDFVDPLKEVQEFDFRSFRYLVTKFKYFELLCLKQEPGPMHDNDFAVEEIVECLKDLEHICPTPEDYRQLCALLTLPKLSDHADFKHWNPSAARVECFHKVCPLVKNLLVDLNPKLEQEYAVNERLVQLITKGIFYEACIDFCQAQALGNKTACEAGPQFTKVLSTRARLSGNDLSLVSWLEAVERAQFTMPFQQKTLDFKIEGLKKPKLEAQWTEHILQTPVKPGGHFPHNLVPVSRLKCAQKMTQSLILPPMSSSFAMEASMMSRSKRERIAHPMSQSMMPDVGFSIQSQIPGEAAMQQSQIISNMFENSELTKTSRPAATGSLTLNPSLNDPRRELECITRRSQGQKVNPLPPVPELSTPTAETPFDNPMTKSRLFQEFSVRQRTSVPPPMPRPPSYDGMIPPMTDPYMMMSNRPMSTIMPAAPSMNPYDPMSRPQSMMGVYNPPSMPLSQPMPLPQPQPMPLPMVSHQLPMNPLPVQFVPLCRYDDSQAIRAVAFHPSGKYFAVGTNSKQLLICKYPDVRKTASMSRQLPFAPEISLSRPKQHRGSVYCCGFSGSGDMIATGSNDKTLRLMSFNSEECKIGAELELTMHDGTVRELIFMDDSSRAPVLVSGGAGNCHICLTDCTTGQTFKELTGHSAPILGLYNWGGFSFVSCSQDKSVRFWDLRAGNAVNVIMPNPRTTNAPVTSVCVDPSGKLLVSGHEDASVMLYDITGGRVIQTFRPHGDEVRTVRFSNAAYYLLSGSYDRRIVITDMRGDLTSPLMYLPVAEHNDKIIQCRWHPQEFTFLSTSADRTVVLWSLPQR